MKIQILRTPDLGDTVLPVGAVINLPPLQARALTTTGEAIEAPLSSVTHSVSGAGKPTTPGNSAFVPWRIASWGDSRSNTGSSGPDVSGSQLISDIRSVTWAAAYLRDCEITRNYGVSGDAAVNWADPARTGGKTFLDLDAASVDLVVVQYGINDAMAATSAATLLGYLKANCAQILKSNKLLVFESTQPINSAVGGYVAFQAVVDSVNSSMQAWLAGFPTVARYCDTASVLKASGYASTAYYNTDGVHLIRPGAQAAGAVLAASIRELLPERRGLFPAPDGRAANLISLPLPSAFVATEVGTCSSSIAYGGDSKGFYTEFTITPLTFSSGEMRTRLEISANFQTSSPPYGALTGAEMIQGACRVVIDDGAGGPPNCYNFGVRQRFYTATVFRDWGFPGTQPAGNYAYPNYSAAVDVQCITPAVPNTAASVVANPSSGGGYQLQVVVNSQATTPFRVRVYNPQLRRVGYKPAPVAVTPPATTVAYTNTASVSQQVTVAGGTVSAIAQNGVATGLTSGQFVLSPGDTLTPTYTVAPTTFLVKHLAA